MERDARIAAGELIDDCRNQTGGHEVAASNPHLPGRRVCEKLDVLHTLAQAIEDGRAAIEQRAPIFSGLDALPVAIEQAHTECMLQFRDRS